MIKILEAKEDQFSTFLRNPFAWEVVGNVSWNLKRGDGIKYIEVDSHNNPTGRFIIGVIRYITYNELLVNRGISVFYYCDKIQQPVSIGIVGYSLIVG